MASYPTNLSIQESEYFNWHCVICSKLALSPLTLEMQHITYDSVVYSDVNNDKWVKCDDCMSPFHFICATSEPEHIVAKQEICLYFFLLAKKIRSDFVLFVDLFIFI